MLSWFKAATFAKLKSDIVLSLHVLEHVTEDG